MKTPLFEVALKNDFEAGFINGDRTPFKFFDFGFVNVNADDVVARFSEAGSCHQANVSGSDNCNIHLSVNSD